ncbi:MAG: methionine--tRNA ligase [Dehalococcoidia bacterium]|nr:MAG: methionine--tRNA ligase [Dehalococcoidia bacterium]
MSKEPEPRRILVAVAWPYANGSLHLGHIAGAYLPADIFARFHRMIGDDVLMVSGSDTHGTPITVRADAEGRTPQEVVDEFHPEFLRYWRELGISFDLFTTTATENHTAVTHDIFLTLMKHGYIYKETTSQLYDPQAQRFLPDRYVRGTCPHCGYEKARGDQCDNCGRTLDPEQLLNPTSAITGAVPEPRDTEHFFMRLSAFQEPLLEWLKSRHGWRKHVLNFSIGFVEEGLHDRAITRDLDWGIPVPVEDLGPGKCIYVWFEAVIGYLSAAKEWAQLRGEPEAWRAWWEDPEARGYYFIGKDNIPFHTIIWPAILMGYRGLNLPYDVPANQYVTFKGEKASKSEGVGESVLTYLERYQPDAIRYALAANLPENSDTDLTEAEIVRRNNDELVATWGNLVNRVLAMTHKNFAGVVPAPGELGARDRELLKNSAEMLKRAHGQLEAVHLKAALQTAMALAQEANAYLNETAPWKTAKTDVERTGTSLYVALCVINALKVALYPFLPFSSQKVHEYLGLTGEVSGAEWAAEPVEPGTRLGQPEPLFKKIDVAPTEGDARLTA